MKGLFNVLLLFSMCSMLSTALPAQIITAANCPAVDTAVLRDYYGGMEGIFYFKPTVSPIPYDTDNPTYLITIKLDGTYWGVPSGSNSGGIAPLSTAMSGTVPSFGSWIFQNVSVTQTHNLCLGVICGGVFLGEKCTTWLGSGSILPAPLIKTKGKGKH